METHNSVKSYIYIYIYLFIYLRAFGRLPPDPKYGTVSGWEAGRGREVTSPRGLHLLGSSKLSRVSGALPGSTVELGLQKAYSFIIQARARGTTLGFPGPCPDRPWNWAF